MNYNFENNISNKKAEEEKYACSLHSIITKAANNKLQTHLKDGGFVAWPNDNLPPVKSHTGNGISEGRLKNGGYVAYPINTQRSFENPRCD